MTLPMILTLSTSGQMAAEATLETLELPDLSTLLVKGPISAAILLLTFVMVLG